MSKISEFDTAHTSASNTLQSKENARKRTNEESPKDLSDNNPSDLKRICVENDRSQLILLTTPDESKGDQSNEKQSCVPISPKVPTGGPKAHTRRYYSAAEVETWTNEQLLANLGGQLLREARESMQSSGINGREFMDIKRFIKFIERMSFGGKRQTEILRTEIQYEGRLRGIDELIERTRDRVEEYGYESFRRAGSEMEIVLPIEAGQKLMLWIKTSESSKEAVFRYICRDSLKNLIQPVEKAIENKFAMNRVVLYGSKGIGKKQTLAALAAYLTARLGDRVVYIPNAAAARYGAIISALLFGFSKQRRYQRDIIDANGNEETLEKILRSVGWKASEIRVFIVGGLYGADVATSVFDLLIALSSKHILVASESTNLSKKDYVYLKGEEWIAVQQSAE